MTKRAMRYYEGKRHRDWCEVRRNRHQLPTYGHLWPDELRRPLWNWSFDWGRGGGALGPRALALALLADVFRVAVDAEGKAVRLHEPFLCRVVRRLPRAGWELTEREIRAVCRGFK